MKLSGKNKQNHFPLLIVSVREMRERFCLLHLRMVQLSMLTFETEKQGNHREGWCWSLIKQDDKLLSLMTSNWASFNFPHGGHWSQMWHCPHLQSVFMSVRTCPYYDTGEICAQSVHWILVPLNLNWHKLCYKGTGESNCLSDLTERDRLLDMEKLQKLSLWAYVV